MNKPQKIAWQDVPRNRFSRGLHLAMLSKDKYCKLMRFAARGDVNKKLYLVEYDKSYVIQWLANKVCKPLNIANLDEFHKFIDNL